MAEFGASSVDENSRVSRNRLISRAVLVAALIVALLAALLIFENKNDETASPERGVIGTPLLAPRIGVAVSAPSLSDELKQAIKEAPDAAQQVLASAAPPEASSPDTPSEGSSDIVSKPVPAPSITETVQPRTGRAIPNGQNKQARQGGSVPDISPLGVSNPSNSNSSMRDSGGFVLQLGVFSNSGNAEELRNRLRSAGIPAQLETRVQVGPFSSKEEAARAQGKLRKLGLDQGMLVTTSKRP